MATSKRICVLGNYSGRNAGDAAILGGLLREIASRYPDVEFVVPTLNPSFVRDQFAEYRLRPVSLLPWNGCIKLLGLPVWRAIRSSDLVLVTDAILFDRNLLNPLHNYLSTLALWIPKARKHGIPVVLYNVSLGPVRTRAGQWCLRRVLKSSELIILRDDDSLKVLEEIGPISVPVVKGADSALSAPACSPDRIATILHDHGIDNGTRPRVAINVNSYGDAFVRDGRSTFSREKLLVTLSEVAEWIHGELNADVWLLGTQLMDLDILRDLARRIHVGGSVRVFTNQRYSYAELKGLLSSVDLLIGMRTHSIILASAMGTPVIGIVTYPKTRGYLKRIDQDQQGIPLLDLTAQRLKDLIRASWDKRARLRQRTVDAVERERRLAWQAAEYLHAYLR